MRSIACGSCCSAGRYSFWMIDGGTFQVGLTVMNFISALMIGVARFGLPTTILVFQTSLLVAHDAQREVRDVDHDVGVAEVARHPAPALHVDEDDVDGLLALAGR